MILLMIDDDDYGIHSHSFSSFKIIFYDVRLLKIRRILHDVKYVLNTSFKNNPKILQFY